LDDPSAGLDPFARRGLFKIIHHNKDSAVLVTTQRMEEAEALCDRMTIMINGKMVCIGSPGHLIQKYSKGYQLYIRVNKS